MNKIFSSILTWLKDQFIVVEAKVEPVISEVAHELPGIIVQGLQVFLLGVEAGTPYLTVLATAGKMVENLGVKAAETAVQGALNKAENNLIEAGTPAPITVAAGKAAATADTLDDTHPAVVSAQAEFISAATAIAAAPATDTKSA